MRLRRSLLFVPGSTPERIAKAVASAADSLILDLEDGVAPDAKARAREWVVAALRRVDFGGRERIVRVNPLEGPHARADLTAVVPAGPDALLLQAQAEGSGALSLDGRFIDAVHVAIAQATLVRARLAGVAS